jgi:hypothetical protein
MAHFLIRNVPDQTVETYRQKAMLNGNSPEQDFRELLEKHSRFTAQERAAVSYCFLDRFKDPTASLTLEDIREGLE